MREVFMLREVGGLSTAETAEALNVSEDVVRPACHVGARHCAGFSWIVPAQRLQKRFDSIGLGATEWLATCSLGLPASVLDRGGATVERNLRPQHLRGRASRVRPGRNKVR